MGFRYSFSPLGIEAGGYVTTLALNTTTGRIVAGGDVEGFFLTDDNGLHWQISSSGVYQNYWHQCACLVWSQTESNTLYAGVGNTGTSGGFLVSSDSGETWSMRSTAIQFAGNHAASPLPSGGQPRSTGNLLAQGAGNIYAATYSAGVSRSSDNGNTWTNIGLSGGTYYGRGLAMDPSNTDTLYFAPYNNNLWKTTNASYTGGQPTWAQLTSAPANIEEVKVIGSYVYAAAGSSGIYRSGDGGNTWTSLNGAFIDTTQSYWLSLDGYASGSTHTIFFGCFDGITPGSDGTRSVVKLTIDGSGNVTYTDCTTTTSNINLTIQPQGKTWWRTQNNTYYDYMGGNSFTPGYILVNPLNTSDIYVMGAEGMYYSSDSGATWQLLVNGMSLFDARGVVVDPNNAQHIFFGSSDWTSFEITDGVASSVNYFSTQAPGAGTQGYSVAIDPVDSTLYLAMGERGTNAEGKVYHKASGASSWTDDALDQAGGTTITDAADSFARTVSSGWGTANTGGAWTVVSGASSAYSVSGGNGNIQLPSNSGGYAIYLDSISLQDSSGSVNVTWNKASTGALHFAQFLIRNDGTTSNAYLFRVQQDPTTGAVTAIIQGILGGTGAKQIGPSATVGSYVQGDTITMAYEIQGTNPTNLYFSAWTGGPSAQPGSWMISTNDSSDGPQVAGAAGLRADGSTGYTAGALFSFSNLSITSQQAGTGPGTNVPLGVAVGRDGSNNRYVLAAVWANGLWRQSNGTWTQVSSVIAADTQTTEFLPFATLSGSNYVYALDRHSGVYRSADYGVTWTLIWSFNTDTAGMGYIALNPLVANELWVSSSTGLYQLPGANSGTVGSGITANTITTIPNPGAIAFDSAGNIYCISLPTASGPTLLMRSIDGGVTWESIGDYVVQGAASRPNSLAVSSNGRIYIGTLSNGMIVGYNIGQSQTT
jgi:hypothetical protein